jgi:hypothetical protein
VTLPNKSWTCELERKVLRRITPEKSPFRRESRSGRHAEISLTYNSRNEDHTATFHGHALEVECSPQEFNVSQVEGFIGEITAMLDRLPVESLLGFLSGMLSRNILSAPSVLRSSSRASSFPPCQRKRVSARIGAC